MKKTRTKEQQAIAEKLASDYDIDAERVLFLNEERPEEPWLPAEALITIARQSEKFQTIDESFDQYIEPLTQVVHRATVIDNEGRTYTRSGVATIKEREDIDDHTLAAGRAVSAALTAAGFNPLRPGTVVSITSRQQNATHEQADEAQSRLTDIRRIHALATEKGLIVRIPGVGEDYTKYRQMLREHFGTNTSAGFDATQRASLINFLQNMEVEIVNEFADVA